ncbi:MAG: WGR domain-containing protein [Methylomonas sp.]|nr:WGR domain-containing protein [Methylomonas sp.]
MFLAYLERHNSLENMHRFYQITVSPGVFGDWSLVREWGRKGSPGTVKKDWYLFEEEAVDAGQQIMEAKRRKGYLVIRN